MPRSDELAAGERLYCPNAYAPLERDGGHPFPPPETNEPHSDGEDWDLLGLSVVDVEAETESKRQESQVRLRLKSHQLKRFHEQLCLRVTARERQNRLEAQRAQQHLDAKCAKLFAKTTTLQDSTEIASERASSRPFFRDLKEQKRVILKDCPLAAQIEKVGQQLSMYQVLLTNPHNANELSWHGKAQSLRLDAQCRDVLLLSTESSRSHCAESGDEYNINAEENVDVPGQSPVLRPEQRAALYATVRRQFMEMGRVNAQSGTVPSASPSPVVGTAKSTPRNKPVAADIQGRKARHSNQEETKGGERRSANPMAVKVVDMTSGCDVKVHRQATTSSTPWRKKASKAPVASTGKQFRHSEHERFLRALQAQLRTPALCSCTKAAPKSISSSSPRPQPCANNCALYKQPKKREKLLASVYKQQQHAATSAAATSV